MEPRCLLSGNINEFPLFPSPPDQQLSPQALITGPDGQLWFSPEAVGGVSAIGRLSTDGRLSAIPLPQFVMGGVRQGTALQSLTLGQDGNVWASTPVARITPAGSTTFVPGPTPGEPLTSTGPAVLGPDGNVWTTQYVIEVQGEVCIMPRPGIEICFPNRVIVANVIHRTTPDGNDLGVVDATPPNHFDADLIRGPDNAMWALTSLTPDGPESIVRIDANLKVTSYPLNGIAGTINPGPNGPVVVGTLIPGPDGNVWFAFKSLEPAHLGQNLIGRITPTGTLSLFPLGSANQLVSSLTFGPDGSLWYIEPAASGGTQLGRLFPSTGLVQHYALPSGAPAQILILGPDGNLWFTERGRNVLGEYVLTAQGNPASPLTGKLDPASDTGSSSSDGITNDTTPSFSGTATPGWVVQVYAKSGGQGAPIPLGFSMADASGAWKVTSLPLGDGSFTVFALAIDPVRHSRVVGDIQTSATGGPLVIDTVPPVVAGAALNPLLDQLSIRFQDRVGLDPASLRNPKSYKLVDRGSRTRHALSVTGVVLTPVAGQTMSETVTVTFQHGRSLPAGRYHLDVQARHITDLAGNALSGLYKGQFPTHTGYPGTDFRAGFITGRFGASPPLHLKTQLQGAGR
jgi:streptogramin lyase